MYSLPINLDEIFQKALLFYQSAESRPFGKLLEPEELKQEIELELSEAPLSQQKVNEFVEQFLKFSINTSHKGYMNQLWSKVEAPSIAGEVLTSVTNTSMYTYEVAPVATLMEQAMVERLGKMVWARGDNDGIMTSGGSASNLQAIQLARHRYFPKIKEQGIFAYPDIRPVVLCAKNAHYSIRRSLNLLGFGHESLIEVNTDSMGRMCMKDLELTLEFTRVAGKTPFMLISTAGTTIEGAYDELNVLGEICQREDLWFHIDGAYGASVLLSDQHQALMQGVQRCDSISWDFHKMLGINMTCAFLLVQKKGLLKSALSTGNDAYLFHDEDSIDLGPKSIQCGRRADIPKLWLTWQSLGRQGLGERVDKLIQGAQNFAEMIDAHPGFELVQKPLSMNVCFRPLHADVEQMREQMLKRGMGMINYSQNGEGKFFRQVISRVDFNPKDFEQLLSEMHQLQLEMK